MDIKSRGRECCEFEEEFCGRRGMSGRGFVTGTQPKDVASPEKWYKGDSKRKWQQ
jgi:hypothetical protein